MIYRTFIIAPLLVFTYGCSGSNNDNGFGLLPAVPEPTPIQPANASEPEWLYVQTAATAQMTSDTTLEIPFTRDVFGFTDRPYRKQAYLTAFDFASLWTAEGANSFSVDAPNAVLTWQVGEEQREAEVIINNATVYADGVQESLVYEVTVEAEQMPDAQMSSVSLFVDSSTLPAGADFQVCSGFPHTSKGECWPFSTNAEYFKQVTALSALPLPAESLTQYPFYTVKVGGQIDITITPQGACPVALAVMGDVSPSVEDFDAAICLGNLDVIFCGPVGPTFGCLDRATD
jgi:hypothetical protein